MRGTYSEQFYEAVAARSLSSAQAVLPIVLEYLQIRSACDVGCGTGEWLGVLETLGVDDVLGIDGAHVPSLKIAREKFMAADLTKPLRLERQFDLAISLEVAEHLAPSCGEQFVDSLVKLAPNVLFSAAVPFQEGVHHVNLRWQDYWADVFAAQGYQACDCIRPQVWNNPDVEPWYAQNTILYCRAPSPDIPGQGPIRAMAHPKLYEKAATPLHLRALFNQLPLALNQALRRRMKLPLKW